MIVFYRLEGRDYNEIGRVEDGEIVDGEEELAGIVHPPNLSDEDELLAAHDGPHILAQMEDESPGEGGTDANSDRGTEKWVPYTNGDERGWISASTGEKKFTEEAPGPIVKGFEEQAENWTEVKTLNKEWIPYQGPHGGEGWQEVETGEVRYVEEPPGRVGTGDGAPPSDGMTPEERAWLEEHGDPEALSELEEEAPDGTTETSEEITWDNVAAGDEIAYYDDYGELQQGEVTAVEQDAFGVIWVQDGHGKSPVEEEDFIGTPDDKIGDGLEAPDHAGADWFDNNLFYGQTIKLYNKNTDMVEYADVESIFVAGGEINAVELEVQNQRGFGDLITITNDDIDWHDQDDNGKYEIRETSRWSDLEKDEQIDAVRRSYRENTRLETMGRATRQNLNDDISEDIIPSFKDMNVARETFKSLFKIGNKVSRASCSGTGSVSIKVSERAPIDTTRHEFGHAIVSSFGYNYKNRYKNSNFSDEKYRRRPTNLSHEYHDLKTRYDTIAFDFSEDSDFFAPEDYMLQDTDNDGEFVDFDFDEIEAGRNIYIEPSDTFMSNESYEIESVGEMEDGKLEIHTSMAQDAYVDREGTVYQYDSFGGGWEEVGEATAFTQEKLPHGFDAWKDAVEEEVHGETDLEQREYENTEGMSPKDVFESVDKGDVVRFQHEDKTIHLIAQEKENLSQEDRRDYEFVHPGDGSQWNFTVQSDNGELQFSDHIVTGYDDTYGEEDGDSPNVDNPLENWEGFEPNPETTEQRIDNLVSAVNRAWYKQAKMFENDPADFGNSAYSIGSGYSATNAQETMAKTHEVLQNGDQLATSHLIEEHPYLVAAYVELFEPHLYAKKAIHRHGGEEYGIKV